MELSKKELEIFEKISLYERHSNLIINDWLCDNSDLVNTEEYEKFTSLYMAFEYAESVLKSRKNI
ncbi:hypothetical protein ACI760_10310 [Capnocytophaga canimorsus]|uniref:hypothetical protein n=1 Tax=Capnocytophaga canimorsus TaxID=28188 RepID=UPI00385F8471